jgi:ABC-type multidrug transport system ATPase subunit
MPKGAPMHVEELTKTYGKGFTLGPISCTFTAGSTVGILGKNGAGKSTFFELITGNADATTGRITLDNQTLTPDRPDLKRRLGYLPQHPVLPKWVTAREILSYAARLHHLPNPEVRVEENMQYWDCATYGTKPLGTLSYGMQKRVGLALATLHRPEILILDEPHSGLDLVHVKALDEAIRNRKKEGKITITSTHVAAFAASLCDLLYMIDQGTMRRLEPWQELHFMEKLEAIDRAFFGQGDRPC